MPWHTLAVGKRPGTLGKCPGALNSEFFIPWHPIGDWGRSKAFIKVIVVSKKPTQNRFFKDQNSGQKIICLKSLETHEFGIKIFETFYLRRSRQVYGLLALPHPDIWLAVVFY